MVAEFALVVFRFVVVAEAEIKLWFVRIAFKRQACSVPVGTRGAVFGMGVVDPVEEEEVLLGFVQQKVEHLYSIDIMRKGARPPNSMQVRGEIERVRFTRGDLCEEAFGSELRRQLDQRMLARAFRPSGGVTEYYQREAMLRLGRLNSGKVETLGGEAFRTGSPIELALALQSASTVRDYLGLLGAIARSQPDPPEFLRALLAPEMTPGEFEPIYDAATRERSTCS